MKKQTIIAVSTVLASLLSYTATAEQNNLDLTDVHLEVSSSLRQFITQIELPSVQKTVVVELTKMSQTQNNDQLIAKTSEARAEDQVKRVIGE